MSRRDRTTGLLAALLVVLLQIAAWREVLVRPGIDFYQFWAVGRVLATDPGRDLYAPAVGQALGRELLAQARSDTSERRLRAADERRVVEVFSTPFLYAVFGALATGDYERDYRSYQLGSLLAGLFGVALLCKALGYGFAGTCLALCLLGMPFEPYTSETVVGNVNRLLLLAMAVFVWLQGRDTTGWRDAAAGGVLGLAILFKPTLAFPAALVIASRLFDGRFGKAGIELAGMAGVALGSLALSIGVLGSGAPWSAWIDALRRLLGEFQVPVAEGNFSLVQLILEATGHNFSFAIGGFLIGTVLAALAVGRVGASISPTEERGASPAFDGGSQQRARDALILGAGAAVTLLAARLAWVHYFLLLTPLFLCVLRPRYNAEHAVIPAAFASLAWLLVSVQPFRLLESRDARIAAGMVACGTALALALAILELVRWRAADRPQVPSNVPAA